MARKKYPFPMLFIKNEKHFISVIYLKPPSECISPQAQDLKGFTQKPVLSLPAL